MKKTFCLLLSAAIFILSLTACGGDGNDTSSVASVEPHPVDVVAEMTAGKIPELPVSLGTSVSDAKKILNALEKIPEGAELDEDHTYYSISERGDVVRLECEGALYYYNKSKRSSGISAIVSFDNAYAFEGGIAMMGDVSTAVNAKGTTYAPTENDLFFVFGQPDAEKYTAIYYTAGSIRLDFFFYDSFLVATVLQNTELWDPTAKND